jgi:hypothetical protein
MKSSKQAGFWLRLGGNATEERLSLGFAFKPGGEINAHVERAGDNSGALRDLDSSRGTLKSGRRDALP